MDAAVDRVLDLVGLRFLQNRMPATLSGGERQKVALARCVVFEPKVILLDEPLSNIDAEAKRGLRDELRRIHRELDATVLHVTHDQLEAFSLADRVAIMNSGELLQVGKVNEVFRDPRGAFVARFMGYENVFDGRLVESMGGVSLVDVSGMSVRVASAVGSEECSIAIWPEDIAVLKTQPSLGVENVFRGRVSDCLDLGSTVIVSVDVGVSFRAVVGKRFFLAEAFQVGEEVWLSFEASAVKLLS